MSYGFAAGVARARRGAPRGDHKDSMGRGKVLAKSQSWVVLATTHTNIVFRRSYVIECCVWEHFRPHKLSAFQYKIMLISHGILELKDKTQEEIYVLTSEMYLF